MTYIIKVWDNIKQRKVLKGFDKNKPVYVTEGEYFRGAVVQECGTYGEAKYRLDKIHKYEHWRGCAIVEVH